MTGILIKDEFFEHWLRMEKNKLALEFPDIAKKKDFTYGKVLRLYIFGEPLDENFLKEGDFPPPKLDGIPKIQKKRE